MNRLRTLKLRRRAGAGLAAAAILCAASFGWAAGADTNAPATKVVAPKPAPKPAAKKKLTGAELYAINCNRCHPERYATEFTSAQWKTIVLHMRVRANLPAAQAKEILKFLKEDAGN